MKSSKSEIRLILDPQNSQLSSPTEGVASPASIQFSTPMKQLTKNVFKKFLTKLMILVLKNKKEPFDEQDTVYYTQETLKTVPNTVKYRGKIWKIYF